MTQTELAIQALGSLGRMISASKSSYLQRNPTNNVVFNGNVCTKTQKIWYGDLDITKDAEKLKELAAALGEDIYVLREMDGRFENEASPLLERARATITAEGELK